MGVNAIRTLSLSLVFMVLTVFFCAPNVFDSVFSLAPLVGISEKTVKEFLVKYHKNYVIEKVTEEATVQEPAGRLFTKEELAKYDGSGDSSGLYLAILGEVFDVSKGAQHYKPGSSYSFFAGRDASRSYITGDFTEEKSADDVSDLDSSSLISLSDWLSFYHEEYTFMGILIGPYYDEKGNPTPLLQTIQEKIKSGQSNKWLEDQEKTAFPPCNSEWSKEKGSRVWCTNKSGGVDRNWVGVPRKFHKTGKDARCVCVRDTGPPSNQMDVTEHSDLGDLEHPNLQQYPNCPPRATSCQVDHP